VIVGGVAITLGERAIYGVDLSSGSVSWTVPRAGGPLSVPAIVPGGGGDPTVLVYLEGPLQETETSGSPTSSASASPSTPPSPSGTTVSPDAAAGSDLVAIELDGRTELWRTPLGGASRTGVAVDAETAYVGDDDGTVTAVSLADGSVRWTRDLRESDDTCAGLAGGKVDVPLAVADARVIAIARNVDGASVAVVALDAATGACLWQKSPQVGSSAVSAAAARDGQVVIGGADRLVQALDGSDGERAWSSLALSVFSPASSPALGPDSLYVVDLGGGLYRLDPRDGGRVWDYQLNGVVVRGSPVVSGETVLVGLRDGRLAAIDVRSGHLVWQSVRSPGLVGAIALSSDVLVAVKGGRGAGLMAFEHDPDGTLLDVPPPTELDLGGFVARAGAAAAIVLILVLVPGMLARRRFGEAFPGPEPEEPGADGEQGDS
jgi:outer membrane protein assembly factor BamB